VTTQGSLVPGIGRHYIRILPAHPDDPSPREDPDTGTVTIANSEPGQPNEFPARDVVDAGFLELVRYGIHRAGTPLVEDSLRVVARPDGGACPAPKTHRGGPMGAFPNRYWTAPPRVPRLRMARRELRHHAAAARLTIDVTGAGFVLTKALRGEVRRRVLLAMSRFGPEVHGVTARLAVVHNGLGGVDQRCRVRVRLHSGLVLRAEAMNGLIGTAVGRSVAHLALLVGAALDDGDGRHRPAPGLRRRRPVE
jgi:hypothetical protein